MARFLVVAVAYSLLLLPTCSLSQSNKENPPAAGINGVGVPSCLYCPAPEYTEQARKARIEGNVVVQAVVTVTGHAQDISVKKGLGYGLDEKAIEVVKKWHFKPARDAAGHPVRVRVPMEVTFRLS